MLKDTEFAYAVARVRSNENKLLTSVAVENLINAKDSKDARKILSEAGYGDFEKQDENQLLSERTRQAFELIYESAPDKSCLDFLIVRNDFHNIKAIIKCMVSRAEHEKLLLSPSAVEPGEIVKALEGKSFDELPHPFGEIVEKSYELITKTMDGQKLEIYLDKMCLETCVSFAEKSRDAFSIDLSKLMSRLCNIKMALRCQKTGKDADFIADCLADVEVMDKTELCNAAVEGVDALRAYINKLGFEKLSNSIDGGYARFEKVSDDMLIEKIRDAKYQSLGIAPLVAYYFATDAEVKTVRIILSCKNNGIDAQSIRERVRVLYV